MAKRCTQMRNKLDIYDKTPTKNELNETIYDYNPVVSIYAEVIPQTGALQRAQADTILTNVTHKINTWYTPELIDSVTGKAKNDLHALLGNRRFDIKFILDPYELKQKMEIFVEEVIT